MIQPAIDPPGPRERSGLHTLRVKLLAFAGALVLVPGIVFAFMAIASARNALENAVGRQLAEIAYDTGADLSDLLERERHNIASWGQEDVMRELLVGDIDKRIARALVAAKESAPAYRDLMAINLYGRVVAASDPALIGSMQGGLD